MVREDVSGQLIGLHTDDSFHVDVLVICHTPGLESKLERNVSMVNTILMT